MEDLLQKGLIYALILLSAVVVILTSTWSSDYLGGLSWDETKTFGYHPALMTFSLLFVPILSITSYRLLSVAHETKKLIHLGLMGLSVIGGGLGLYAVFKFHSDSDIKDLYSMHSWIGLTTYSIFVVMFISNFYAFQYPGVTPQTRKSLMPYHVFAGIAVMVMAMATMLTGIMEKLTFYTGTAQACIDGTNECTVAMFDSFVIYITLFVLLAYIMLFPHRSLGRLRIDREKNHYEPVDGGVAADDGVAADSGAAADSSMAINGGGAEYGTMAA